MSRLLRRSNVRGSLFDYAKIAGQSNERCYLLNVSEQTMALLADIAQNEVNWYSRYELYSIGDMVAVADESDPEAGIIDRIAQDFRLQVAGETMEISQSILALADAIRESACCNTAGGSGSGGSGGSPTEPSPGQDTGGVPPAGWTGTYEEYQEYKCDVAYYILSSMKSDMDSFQLFNWTSLVTLSLSELILVIVGTILSPIPGDELLAVIAAVAAYTGAFEVLFSDIKTRLDTCESDLLCAMYNAENVGQAEADLRSELASCIDGAGWDAIKTWVSKQIVFAFTSTDNLNKLFEDFSTRDFPDSPVSCSSCGEGLISWATSFQFGAYTADPAGGPMGSGPLGVPGTHTLSSVPGLDPGLNPIHVLSFTYDPGLDVWNDNGQVRDIKLNWTWDAFAGPGGGTSGQQRADVATCVCSSQGLPGLGTPHTHTRGVWMFKASPFTWDVTFSSEDNC